MERRGILQYIKNCLDDAGYDREISGKPGVTEGMEALRSDLYKHYGYKDYEAHDCHQLRFFLLYIEKNDLTYEDIAEETFLSGVPKLKKRIKRYNDLALKIVTEESRIDPDYAFLLEKYRQSGL